MLTAEQLRAARGFLRWDQSTVAERAGVSIETIKRLERMDGPLMSTKTATLHAIEEAFRSAGLEFIPENGGGAGIRFRERKS
ncbi:helix-turn-helix domain-containing protein [Methylobacterium sp. J-059]|uniref:helix-turn-helix domain-containing protein n=1 Tax=Methylobacterium sp. J-059 TaxID=2836643 RepID=UPI001FB89DF5|nr:helix-turn-helix domain-containing protein [Methylobacterium sp. J-059]MCJ2039049.1 helix-turn-helix domain-containing protein [Methylobacterium sp. J-059]